jgi:2-amino-4-hydroxy-6-hydroxymethyldihydropteridine diphosphokinase
VEIGLCLGTNLGDRMANLRAAASALAELEQTDIIARSAVYETEPVDVSPEHRDQAFLNAVLVLETALDVRRISRHMHAIEDEMGRVRTSDRNAPRPIDIDIIYADGIQLEEDDLTVPHPEWAGRRFVVQPLADVRPGFVLPGTNRTVSDVLLSLPQEPKVIPSKAQWQR